MKAHRKADLLKQLFRIDPAPLAEVRTRGVRPKGLEPSEDPTLKNLIEFIKHETPLPAAAIEWLGLLGLLYGVPFNNLAADEKLLSNAILDDTLPPEQWLSRLAELYHIDPTELKEYEGRLDTSTKAMLQSNALRFFYIDPNWINSLIDGALSIGIHNSVDFKLQLALHKAFKKEIEQVMVDHRVKLQDKPIVPNVFPEQLGTMAGLLFRSPIVAQWTGLEIVGFRTEQAQPDDPEQMLDILRMERLAPSIMLVIFKGIPKKVLIKEPTEGISSGLEVRDEKTYQIVLRHFTGENEIGKPYQDGQGNSLLYTLDQKTDFRDVDQRTLNIRDLKGHLLQAIKAHDPSIKDKTLSPKDLGVELINSPRWFSYTPSGKIQPKAEQP